MNLRLLIPLFSLFGCAAISAGAPVINRPNIVIIVADDLGWGDVGWHGSSIKTPHLDRLVRAGVELDQHYVSPMCSPTRAAILSGRYASRFGVTGAQNELVYPRDTVTLARALHQAGYATAITGKWHLGSKAEWGPNKFGFDHSYGAFAGGTGPYDHRYKKGEYTSNWHRNGEFISEEGHVTDLIAREAIRWIEPREAQPFFLYLPFTAPHIPIDEPDRWLDLYPTVEPLSRRHYAASVTHMDDAVGQVVAALERTGKLANTVIVFTSDNGATPNVRNDDTQYPGTYPPGPAGGSNLPLRGKKTELWEGGIRVPAFVYWPAKLKPAKFTAPVHAADWMPTLCAIAGWQAPQDLRWDGRNVWPSLTGERPVAPRALYWAGTGFRSRAVRDGDWKLIVQEQATDGKAAALFDLAADPNETTDLAAQQPERVAALKALLAKLAAADTAPRPPPIE
ncbi:MAG: arylsulfatase B [Opitutaceae bacterium]